jgi:hypothetical protein
VQEVAFVLVQVRVLLWPRIIVAGDAVRVRVGAKPGCKGMLLAVRIWFTWAWVKTVELHSWPVAVHMAEGELKF